MGSRFISQQSLLSQSPAWPFPLFLAIAMSFACAAAWGANGDDLLRRLAKPPENRPVHDLAHLLTPAERDQLESRCLSLRKKSGAALVVVTLPSLAGGEIDDFTNKLFAQWHPGDKDRKDGILMLVAVEERKARIEVGYGLEPILPDALAGRILHEQLFPAFKQQHYAEGLTSAVNRVADIIEKGEPPSAEVLRGAEGPRGNESMLLMLFLSPFIAIGSSAVGGGLALLFPAGAFPSTTNGRRLNSNVGDGAMAIPQMLFGAAFAGIAFLIAAVAAPWSLFLNSLIAVIFLYVGWRSRRSGNDWFRPSGGWGSGSPVGYWGTWPGSGNSSSWSGGGFSNDWGGFGGGSSGGGGASGGW